MNFECSKQDFSQACCPPSQPCPQPSLECLKVFSVLCSKSVQKVAELQVTAGDVGLPTDTPLEDFNFNITARAPDIIMRGTLLEGKVVNSGFVPVTVTVTGPGLPITAPLVFNLNLPFQGETECPGACPGDDLQETVPIIEGILEPVVTPQTVAALSTVTFKVIIRTQITVSREKLVQASVNVLGDINEDRCTTLQPTQPASRTVTFFNGT